MPRSRHGVTEFLSVFHDVGRVFFDLETDLLVVLNERGEIYDCNPAVERELNRPRSSVLGVPLARFIDDGDLLEFIQEFYKPQNRLFRLLRRESDDIRVRLIASRSQDEFGYIVLRRIT